MDTDEHSIESSPANSSTPRPRKMLRTARAANKSGDYAGAVAHFQAAIAASPENPRLHIQLGHALLKLQRQAEAEAAFCRASELDPANVQAKLGAARSAWARGDRSEAIVYLEAVASANPNDQKIQIELAAKLLDQLRLEEAEAVLRRVIKAEPHNVFALIGLAECLAYQGDRDEALRTLRVANEIQPDNVRLQEHIKRLEGGHGEDIWKTEISEALANLPANAEKGVNFRAAQKLLFYGITAPLKSALAPLEKTSAPARRLLQMARQLDSMGLSITAKATSDIGDEAEQLNNIRGFTERLTPGANTLVLVFTGVGDRAFLSMDVIHRMLRKTGASLVYLRDINRSLYLSGIVGLAEDYDRTVEAFKAIVSRSGARRVLLIGHCGGCSAALRFGLALNAEAVLAITPRILSRAAYNSLRSAPGSDSDRTLRPLGGFSDDLISLYREAEIIPRVTLLYGARMEPECSFGRDMAIEFPAVTIAEVPGARKDIIGIALGRGLLSPLFSSFVTEGSISPDVLESLGGPNEGETPLSDGHTAAESPSPQDA